MRLHKPSPAMLVALLALFVALGGSSYAAITLSNNSVKSKHIAKGAVKRSDIGKNAVTAAKVANGSLTGADVKDQSLTPSDFSGSVQGPQGPQGVPGPQGERGLAGQDATKLFGYIRDSGSAGTATVEYGSGVTAVEDPAGNNTYTVTFARSLENCVVQAAQGIGRPSGTASTVGPVMPDVGLVFTGDPNQAIVSFYNTTPAQVDTAFMIAAFC